jgi:serine/threonine protein kinase
MLEASAAPSLDESCEIASQDAELARVLEACLADIEAGRPVALEQLVAEHPDIAERLETCFNTLNLVQQAAAGLGAGGSGKPTVLPVGRLGDFDIIREVGRGGMGVVYEAKQISLGRRVALKVLPFAATLDPRQLQRFWTEAQAAAILHHVHIVPVYSVGCERGVHYYAMQFIEGQTLAALIDELRRGRPLAEDQARPQEPTVNDTPVGLQRSTVVTHPSFDVRHASFFGAIARLGVQAAEALEHAHQLGVVHRDIKPANLLVDSASNLWVTDFGLARLRTHAGLTLTGDTVGTLRYMSPEQALAKRALVDHRTDIYSLGSTLYEAATLQQAYPGDDRQEVLRRISLGEPPPPRRINPRVPFELETIILKAMAREPERRYATAQELAEDLKRFLDHRPVLATRPTVREKVSKWAWRHRPVLATVFAVSLVAVLGLLVLTGRLWYEKGQTKAALERAQTKEEEALANQERAEANFRKALDGLYQWLWELENPRWAKGDFQNLRHELTRQGLAILNELAIEGSSDPAVRFQTARAYELMVNVYLVEGKLEEAAQTQRKAIALFEGLEAEQPENTEFRLLPARLHWILGNWYVSYKRHREAKEQYELACAVYRRALPYDRDGRAHNNLAALLCDCEETELRDPIQALAQAMQALALAPRERKFWNTLGLAHYRAGEWRAARAALEKSMELAAGGDANDWLVLSMNCWHQGEQKEARTWYDKAADWLESHPPTDELYHLRRDAAKLLGIRWP